MLGPRESQSCKECGTVFLSCCRKGGYAACTAVSSTETVQRNQEMGARVRISRLGGPICMEVEPPAVRRGPSERRFPDLEQMAAAIQVADPKPSGNFHSKPQSAEQGEDDMIGRPPQGSSRVVPQAVGCLRQAADQVPIEQEGREPPSLLPGQAADGGARQPALRDHPVEELADRAQQAIADSRLWLGSRLRDGVAQLRRNVTERAHLLVGQVSIEQTQGCLFSIEIASQSLLAVQEGSYVIGQRTGTGIASIPHSASSASP